MTNDVYAIADSMNEDAKTRLRKFAKRGVINKEGLASFQREGLIGTDEYDSFVLTTKGASVLRLIERT